MASASITTKKVTLRTDAIKRAAAQSPAVRAKLEDQFRKFTGRQMTNLVTEYYQEAINQAARVVDTGVPGAEQGADVTIATRFGPVNVGFWQAFKARYFKAKKRYHPGTEGLFWKLKGSTGKYLLKVAIGVKSAKLSKVKATPASGGKSQVSVRISSTITAPSTGDPVIDGLMRNSFVQGQPTFVRSAPEGVSPTPAGIIAITESRRPLISQLAATLGSRVRQALGKIKQ